jgi:DNA repair protein RecO (recombination protein O)
MLEVDGFVLSEIPYGESSKIINVLTRDYGVIGIMCKGAKSLKNRYRVPTMKLGYSHFNIMYKENKLSTLVSADVINPFKLVKSDILLVSFLAYLTELTSQVVKQSNDIENIYDDFIKTILKLEDGLDPIVLTNILEIKYLEYLGVLFNLDECVICGSKNNIATFDADKGGYICINCLTNEIIVDKKVIKMIRMYYYVNIDSIKEIKVDDVTKNTINKYLDLYYERYTGLYLNSKDFLKKLM